jgi:hypothetical protein
VHVADRIRPTTFKNKIEECNEMVWEDEDMITIRKLSAHNEDIMSLETDECLRTHGFYRRIQKAKGKDGSGYTEWENRSMRKRVHSLVKGPQEEMISALDSRVQILEKEKKDAKKEADKRAEDEEKKAYRRTQDLKEAATQIKRIEECIEEYMKTIPEPYPEPLTSAVRLAKWAKAGITGHIPREVAGPE